MKRKGKANRQNQVNTNDLLFISDVSIRKKIVAAIETISGLYLVEKDTNYSTELTKEIRRIIILYAASIVEAILLYLYKKLNISSPKIEYKDVNPLPKKFQNQPKSIAVIAKQIKTPKNERELMLDVLLKLFSEKKVINKNLEKKIKKAKDIRNTFHLSKSRTGLGVSSKIVQISTEAVYETIISVKRYLEKNNLKKSLKESSK